VVDGADYAVVYTMDLVGNRTKLVRDKAGATNDQVVTYTYNAKDRLLTENTSTNGGTAVTTTYGYDLNGSLTSKQKGATTDTYGYDLRDRMTSATVGGVAMSFAYDDADQRVKRVEGSTTTLFHLDRQSLTGYPQLIEEKAGASPTATTVPTVGYVVGHDELIQRKTDDALHHLAHDLSNRVRPQVRHRYAYANVAPTYYADPTGFEGIGGVTATVGIYAKAFAIKVGAAWQAYDKAQQIWETAGFINTVLATGTVNPIALAAVLSNFVPFGSVLRKIKPVGNALDGASGLLTSTLQRMGKFAGKQATQKIGELGAGLAIKAKGFKHIGFEPGYHGYDDIVEDGLGNYIIVEAKGGAAELGETLAGQQMSPAWVQKKIERLLNSDNPANAAIAEKLMEARDTPGRIKGMLVETRIDADGTVLDPVFEIKDYDLVNNLSQTW
jgi:hypothetical protein